jgi:Mg2+ and Co2+ transporter CorA
MDSMVDVFMPLIDFIEEEADLIDSQIIHHDGQVESPLAKLADAEDAFVAEERRRLSREEDEREAAEAAAAAAAAAAEPAGDGSSASSDEFAKKQRAAGLEAHELKDRRASATRSGPGGADPGARPVIASTSAPTVAEWLRSHCRWLKVEKGDFIVLRRLVLALYPLIARALIILSLHPAQRYARRQRRAAKRGPRVEPHDFDRKAMLKHMVGMRRLVTGLNRLLVPKLEVVGRLRKRAADNRSGARLGADVGEQMATYFGDIQGATGLFLSLSRQPSRALTLLADSADHILSMQQTLAYGEHVLSQSQQAYLAQLNVTLASIKNSSQSSILTLSIVTIGVLAPTVVTGATPSRSFFPIHGLELTPAHPSLPGLNSLNVYLPHNGDPDASPPPPAPHILFGIIAGVIILFLIGFVLLVRYWKRSAKRRFRKKREAFY